jgi:hypothetical protein
MKTSNAIDAARIELLLADLRLPAMKLMWADLAARADKEGWLASRSLAALAEHEIADRGRRRICAAACNFDPCLGVEGDQIVVFEKNTKAPSGLSRARGPWAPTPSS